MSSLWDKSRVLVLKSVEISNSLVRSLTQMVVPKKWNFGKVFSRIFTLSMPEESMDSVQADIRNLIAKIRAIIGPEQRRICMSWMHILEKWFVKLLIPWGLFSQFLELKNSHQSSVLFRQMMKGGVGSGSAQHRIHNILFDIIQFELCLTFSCRDGKNIEKTVKKNGIHSSYLTTWTRIYPRSTNKAKLAIIRCSAANSQMIFNDLSNDFNFYSIGLFNDWLIGRKFPLMVLPVTQSKICDPLGLHPEFKLKD